MLALFCFGFRSLLFYFFPSSFVSDFGLEFLSLLKRFSVFYISFFSTYISVVGFLPFFYFTFVKCNLARAAARMQRKIV